MPAARTVGSACQDDAIHDTHGDLTVGDKDVLKFQSASSTCLVEIVVGTGVGVECGDGEGDGAGEAVGLGVGEAVPVLILVACSH